MNNQNNPSMPVVKISNELYRLKLKNARIAWKNANPANEAEVKQAFNEYMYWKNLKRG